MMLASLIALVVSAPGDIDEVVVLPDRAEVIRIGTAPCASGTAEVVFSPLPNGLDARTLRATASGRTEVLGLRHEQLSRADADDTVAAQLRRQAEALDDQKVVLDHRQQSLQERKARLDRWVAVYRSVLAEEARDNRPSRRKWSRALDAFRRKKEKLAADRRTLDIDRKKWGRKKSKLDRQRAQRPTATTPGIRATVSTKCRGQQAKVSLAYIVARARWRAEYDIDYRPGSRSQGRVRLTLSALVEQSTGEDWRNVRLKLSTARPRLGVEAPRPAAIFVDGQKRKTKEVLVQRYVQRESLSEGGAGAERKPTAAAVDDRGNTVTLTAPGRVTIVSDGRIHWVPVDETEGPARLKRVALPRLKRAVYRVAEFENPAGYPLFGGRINTYVRGAFVGHAPLDFVGPRERTEISLGLEAGIALERRVRSDKTAVRGFLSKSKHTVRAYRSTVENRTDARVQLEVREQIPVSLNEAIEVRMLEEGMTKPYRLDKERGIVSWMVTVGPNKSENVDIAFEIELPDDWKVN